MMMHADGTKLHVELQGGRSVVGVTYPTDRLYESGIFLTDGIFLVFCS